ncbi:unnamed protein product [Echinostoma caproni]|uniref:DUF5641 domain-containing protein n=1 Tax=Echinostoma caproni TaxID=27848 RepID=A0A183ANV5_9TREM|nr:unnamed protein product [Echinostoma caproni]
MGTLRKFRVNEIVLLADEILRRDEWSLAIIRECLPDEDGLVRTVKVRTAAGETLRDIRRICNLEEEEAESTGNPSSGGILRVGEGGTVSHAERLVVNLLSHT